MKKTLFLLQCMFWLIFGSQLTGCLNGYREPMSEEEYARQFVPFPGVSTLYIFRSEGLAEQVEVPILLNGAPVGKTAARSFLVIEVKPGVQTIVSKTTPEDQLTISTEAGQMYFIWQEIKLGLLSPRSKLHVVDAEDGMEGVNACRLMKGLL